MLPDFHEAHTILEANTMTLKQKMVITIPPQPPAVRILIQEYLQDVLDNAEYFTEYIEADDEVPEDTIIIVRMPWSVVLQWAMNQGLTASS